MANNVINRVWNQNRMVTIDDLKGMIFQAESGGHTFQISGVDDAGNVIALSGSVAGVFLRPDNTDVAITGSASGGVVSVTLPASCYDVPGRFGLTVFVTDNGQKTAVYAAIGTVSRTSSGTVSPGTTSDVVDLINQINAAVATIPASWTGLMADIAPTYSDAAVYPVGAYVYYNGDLYRCTTAITTAESWTAGHWTAAVLGNDVSDLKSAFESEAVLSGGMLIGTSGYTSCDDLPKNRIFSVRADLAATIANAPYTTLFDILTLAPSGSDTTANWQIAKRRAFTGTNDICFRLKNGGTWSAWKYGLTSDILSGLLVASDSLPASVTDCDSIPNNTFFFVSTGVASALAHAPFSTACTIITLSAFASDTTGNWQLAKKSAYTGSGDFKMRFQSGGTWSPWYSIVNSDDLDAFESEKLPLKSTNDTTDRTADILARLSNTGKCELGNGVFYVKGLQMPDNTALIGQGNSTRLIMSGSGVTDIFNPAGIQSAWGAPTGGVYQGRLSDLSDVPIATAFTANTQYIVKMTAKNTAVSASTSVGLRVRVKYTDSDTKVTAFGFTLNSSDWQTRTYTTEAGRTVESITYNYSSGASTVWAIKDVAMQTQSGTAETGSAIEVGHQCAVRDLWLSGSEIDCTETVLATDGGRNGLYIAPQKFRISVENCYISDFTGSGIYAINNSTNVIDGSHFDNDFITRNHVGLNFYDKFEYNRVSNCSVGRNYIGIINNGGNNCFSGCGINANFSKGFVIDNLDGSHNNSGHGSCVGCNLNHNGHNTGDAVYIGGSSAGFVFDGCNIFYGHITLDTASRVIFSGMNFGSSIVIDITGGGLVLFTGASFRDDLVANIASNEKVRFVACYNQDGVTVDPTT